MSSLVNLFALMLSNNFKRFANPAEVGQIRFFGYPPFFLPLILQQSCRLAIHLIVL